MNAILLLTFLSVSMLLFIRYGRAIVDSMTGARYTQRDLDSQACIEAMLIARGYEDAVRKIEAEGRL